MTRLIETNVKLIAVDQQSNPDIPPEAIIARTVTVSATPQQVASLAQAQSTGRLALSLVGADDQSVATAIEVDQQRLLGIEEATVVEEKPERRKALHHQDPPRRRGDRDADPLHQLIGVHANRIRPKGAPALSRPFHEGAARDSPGFHCATRGKDSPNSVAKAIDSCKTFQTVALLVMRAERPASRGVIGKAGHMTISGAVKAGLAGLMLACGPLSSAAAAETLQVLRKGTARDLSITMNQAVVVESDVPFAELSIANPQIADFSTLSERTIYVLGKAPGRTTLTLAGRRRQLITNVDVRV